MSFACQKNPYLKELVSRVISCTAVKENLYEIVLDDTVLFPEGGGQPDDRGKIGEVNVQRVLRRGGTAVHIVDKPIEEGSQYKCVVDWTRRFDHMQQHSGQHLLSAVSDAKYGFHTTSWDLGKKVSHVELNTSKITQDQIDEIERDCNERIREKLPVIVHYLTKEEAMDLEEVKSRGLPDDHVGPVRVIEIQGVEKNMCCGTHVANLSHIQVIKLLKTEPMRGGTKLFFLAGNRVLSKLASAVNNEHGLTKILSCGPEEHVKAVEKIQKNVKSLQKTCKSYLREISKLEALQLKDTAASKGYICHHRDDGDMDYINIFMNEIQTHSKGCVLFISVGETKSGGQFVLTGPEDKVSNLGPRICSLLDGKGGGKKGRFQGRAGNYIRLDEANKFVQNSC